MRSRAAALRLTNLAKLSDDARSPQEPEPPRPLRVAGQSQVTSPGRYTRFGESPVTQQWVVRVKVAHFAPPPLSLAHVPFPLPRPGRGKYGIVIASCVFHFDLKTRRGDRKPNDCSGILLFGCRRSKRTAVVSQARTEYATRSEGQREIWVLRRTRGCSFQKRAPCTGSTLRQSRDSADFDTWTAHRPPQCADDLLPLHVELLDRASQLLFGSDAPHVRCLRSDSSSTR